MNINITGSAKGSNKGSVAQLARYLEKENRQRRENPHTGSVKALAHYLEKENRQSERKEWFFSQERNHVSEKEVVRAMDNNKFKLKRKDAKFYLINISPSQKELEFIGNDPEKLKAYTRSVMDGYAKNFNRGIRGKDLLYFAKIEYQRHYKGFDREVKEGLVKQGDPKPGLQTHIHVIVSRKDRYNERQFSPLSKHQHTKSGPVQGGFPRKAFYIDAEKRFDEMFGYPRTLQETFHYRHTMKYGTLKEKAALLKELQQQDHKAERTGSPKMGRLLKAMGRAASTYETAALEREVQRSVSRHSENQL